MLRQDLADLRAMVAGVVLAQAAPEAAPKTPRGTRKSRSAQGTPTKRNGLTGTGRSLARTPRKGQDRLSSGKPRSARQGRPVWGASTRSTGSRAASSDSLSSVSVERRRISLGGQTRAADTLRGPHTPRMTTRRTVSPSSPTMGFRKQATVDAPAAFRARREALASPRSSTRAPIPESCSRSAALPPSASVGAPPPRVLPPSSSCDSLALERSSGCPLWQPLSSPVPPAPCASQAALPRGTSVEPPQRQKSSSTLSQRSNHPATVDAPAAFRARREALGSMRAPIPESRSPPAALPLSGPAVVAPPPRVLPLGSSCDSLASALPTGCPSSQSVAGSMPSTALRAGPVSTPSASPQAPTACLGAMPLQRRRLSVAEPSVLHVKTSPAVSRQGFQHSSNPGGTLSPFKKT